MPEIVTRHPDIVLQLLKDTGAKCGTGEKQKILKACPKDHFCMLPTGELCVYGIKDIASMTQISSADLAAVSSVPTIYSSWGMGIAIISCLFGIFFGMFLKRK